MSALTRLAAFVSGLAALAGWALAAVDVQVVRSPGGIEAWLVEERGLPIISIQAGFDGGSRLDPKEKAGLAYLAASLLNEGAGDMDSTAFMGALEDKAIYFGGSSDEDSFYVSLTTLTANKDEAFRLAELALTKPRLDPEAIDRMKAQIAAYQRRLDENPNAIASLAWSEQAFGDHPYARREIGTADTLAAVTREDVVRFLAEGLGRDKLSVVIVGDIGADEAGPLIDRLFGGFAATRALADPPKVEKANGGAMKVIDLEIPQSVVIFGAPGVGVKDPDFRAAQVMNYVLGGGSFSSRLMQEVREKRGLTYGISTGLTGRRFGPMLMGSVASENAKVKEAIEITKAEIARMRDGGITDQELADAKAFLTGSYPLGFDSNGKIASRLLGLKMDGFDPGFVNRRNAEVEAVTTDDVARAAKRLLDPAAFSFVVVGRPEGLN